MARLLGKNNPYWKGGKTKCKCVICGKNFESYIDKSHKGKYCSRKCYESNLAGKNNPSYKNGNIEVECKVCKKKFIMRYADHRRNRGQFCARSCRGLYGVKHYIKNKGTDIEILLEQWLKEKSISYESQKIIDNITVVDFFIEPNICIYADGDYWHSLSTNKERDIKVNSFLIERGYKVIRLLGSDIKRGIRPCLN